MARAERISPRFKLKAEWEYGSVRSFTSRRRCFKLDKIHLNSDGPNNVENFVKEKLLYSSYKKKLNDAGNTKVVNCKTNNCHCSHLYQPRQ